MRSLSNRTALALAFLFAGVPLAFIAGVVVFQMAVNVPRTQMARQNTVLGFQALRTVNMVDHLIQDAERSQRGYLITGDEAYLAPYLTAKSRLPDAMLQLQDAIKGEPEQQRALLKLQADLTTKMNELAAGITAMRERGPGEAKAIVETDIGLHSMSAISGDLNAILASAEARLNHRLQDAAAAEQAKTRTFLVSSLIAAASLILGAMLLAWAGRRAAVSEQVLQSTLESVREGVGAFDIRNRLRAWNNAFAEFLGLPANEVRRGDPLPPAVVATPLGQRLRELRDAAAGDGRPVLAEHPGPGGVTFEVFQYPAADGGYVITILDVTERRRAEALLRQAQRLDSMGRMTGGVAHDFNNLLTIIIGNLDLLRRAIARDERARERVEMLQAAAERASRLTKQLLAFARQQPLRPEIVNLERVLREMLPLIRRAVGEGVAVDYSVTGGLGNTTVDTAEFQSALLNLAINARDAMPGGGKLTLEIGNAVLDDAYAAQHAEVEPGQYVMLAITDSGTGMDQATAERALDPFFTTKPVGEGTGLGLPQVYGFVKQSGGHLKIYSELGEGTTVKLYLPRSLGREATIPPAASLAVAGSETILLVDDDEIVRTTVAMMLEDLGYSVLQAPGGTEALAILQGDTRIDLLFTDVVMPGSMSGRQLADRALELEPDLRVLFTSGYTENAIVHHGRLDRGVELLSKPYGRDQLAAKLRRVLDAKPQQRRRSGND